MQYRKKLLTAIVIISTLGYCPAFAGLLMGNISLKEAVMLAMRNNPTILSNEINRVSDKFALATAYHNFDPIFSLAAVGNASRSTSAGVVSNSRSMDATPQVQLKNAIGTTYTVSMDNTTSIYYNPNVTLQVLQPLMQGSGFDVVLQNLNNAKDTEITRRLAFRDSVVSVINTVTSDYRAIVSAEKQLLVQQQNLKKAMDDAANTQKQIDVGRAAAADLVAGQSSVAQQQVNLVTAENTLIQSKQALLLDLGLDSDNQFEVDLTVDVPKLKLPSLETCQRMALNWSAAYQGLLINQRILNRALLVAQDAKRWQLNFTGTAVFGAGSGGGANDGLASMVNGRNSNQSAFLNLTVPLDVFSIESVIVSAKIALQNNAIAIAQSRRSILSDIFNKYSSLQLQEKSVQLSIQSEQLAEKLLEQTIAQMQVGRKTQLDVNQTRASLISQQTSLISTEISFLNQITAFRALLGLTLDDWYLKIRY